MMDPSCHETLAELRIEIDRIDAALHKLLMERGEIIHRLIEAKARQGGGLAFRPGREADMMRALVSRHRGLLPLDTVESVWRIIISTFTFVQSNYSVHADISGGDAPIRDCCRFHFGFTVPYVPQAGAEQVIEAVAASCGDLGVIPVETGEGPWWCGLARAGAPKIMARLPFVERGDHPAGMPVFIIGQPLAEAAVRDVVLYDVTIPEGEVGFMPGPRPHIEILDWSKQGSALFLMVAAEADAAFDEWRKMVTSSGAAGIKVTEIGSHAARFDAASIQKVAAQ